MPERGLFDLYTDFVPMSAEVAVSEVNGRCRSDRRRSFRLSWLSRRHSATMSLMISV